MMALISYCLVLVTKDTNAESTDGEICFGPWLAAVGKQR
jgi:hypothetical protein